MRETAIITHNLCKSFGSTEVVSNVSLTVEAGDIYGFLGPNGAGKTTTIRMLLGLIQADKGSAELNGCNIKTDFNTAISQVGAVVEVPSFYTYLSGYDNLKLMANLISGIPKGRIDEVLEMTGMGGKAKDRVGTYSTGMKQRLGIARALLNNPRLVILDEPTNGLDPQGIIEIRESIIRMNRELGITFFLSSHLLHEIELTCTKVGILQKGKLLAQGYVKDFTTGEQEIVEIRTRENDRARDILEKVNYVQGVDASDQGVLVRVKKGHSAKLNHLLVSQNIPIDYLIPRHQSLEESFIKMTKGGDTGAPAYQK